jgi:sulfonate transport system ATP-binding protein
MTASLTSFAPIPDHGIGLSSGATGDMPAGLPVELSGLSKTYGRRTVLDGLSLQIGAGQFVAVIGRSGGGKSTLLRLLAGLDAPSAGAIKLEGQDVVAQRARIRLIFQEPRLLPWQSLLGNVGIARGFDWRGHAQQALADVGLAERASDWPAALSGGQKQRVALARALVSDPRLLLLDEPFGALDALTRRDMQGLLMQLWRRRGFTTLLVTHDVAEAVALADRILVLKDGALAKDLALPPRTERDLAGLTDDLLTAL